MEKDIHNIFLRLVSLEERIEILEKKIEMLEKKKKKKEEPFILKEAYNLAEIFANKMALNSLYQAKFESPTRRKKFIIEAAKAITVINVHDHKTWDEIENIINWVQQDSFWFKTICSGFQLRKHFETLQAQMEKRKAKKTTWIERLAETELDRGY